MRESVGLADKPATDNDRNSEIVGPSDIAGSHAIRNVASSQVGALAGKSGYPPGCAHATRRRLTPAMSIAELVARSALERRDRPRHGHESRHPVELSWRASGDETMWCMRPEAPDEGRVRTAELIGALCLATDLGWASRSSTGCMRP